MLGEHVHIQLPMFMCTCRSLLLPFVHGHMKWVQQPNCLLECRTAALQHPHSIYMETWRRI